MTKSTFYHDGYRDAELGNAVSPPDFGVYAIEYCEGYERFAQDQRKNRQTVANWQSRMTDQEFLEHARGYTAARGFSVIERLVKIIDKINK